MEETKKPQPSEELREELACLAHDMWAGWMKYMTGKIKMGAQRGLSGDGEVEMWLPNGLKHRWGRQMRTKYEDLPESEKESDRKEADKMIEIFERHFARHLVRTYLNTQKRT